jgi:very-short-patch-repair endonuclease
MLSFRAVRRLIENARAMRKGPTDAEAFLWRGLRHKQMGVRFRRQHPVAGYILDFYSPAARLAVELDGGGHAESTQGRRDQERDLELGRLGIRVLRFWNPEVIRAPDSVLEVIWDCVHDHTAVLPQRGRVDVP